MVASIMHSVMLHTARSFQCRSNQTCRYVRLRSFNSVKKKTYPFLVDV
jgi:hypothetical protein